MSLGRVLLDSAVFIYAVGVEHPYREPSRALVAALGRGELDGHTTVLVLQEVLHQRARRTGDRQAAVAVARDVRGVCHVHDVTDQDLEDALGIYLATHRLDAADAVHAAVALNQGIGTVVSGDRAFAEVAGIAALDPTEAAALL